VYIRERGGGDGEGAGSESLFLFHTTHLDTSVSIRDKGEGSTRLGYTGWFRVWTTYR
jgi:hypothetical protein